MNEESFGQSGTIEPHYLCSSAHGYQSESTFALLAPELPIL